MIIFFFEHYYPEIAEPNYIIQMDVDIPFDVPNHDHNVSSKMPQSKSHSSVNQKLVSSDYSEGNGQRHKLHKTKSRSLTDLDTFEEDPKQCEVADCTKDLSETLCPKTCSEHISCQIADCTKPRSTKLCPKTCAKRPNVDSGCVPGFCPIGQYCDSGVSCVAGCTAASTCPPGKTCDLRSGAIGTCSGCTPGSCPIGQYCDSGTSCVAGCTAASNCPPGTSCDLSSGDVGTCSVENEHTGSNCCLDTNYGATDRYGDGCSYYDKNGQCGRFDDDDFEAKSMCCSCKVVYHCSSSADCPTHRFCHGGWCTNKPPKYSLITDKGSCKVDERETYRCKRQGVSSKSRCEDYCSRLSACIAYAYRPINIFVCFLVPSVRSCPSGFTSIDESGPVAASMNDLKVWSNRGWACSGKTQDLQDDSKDL